MTGEPSARNAEAGEPAEGFGERFAVEGGHIAVEPSLGALVNPPAGMFDALFERRSFDPMRHRQGEIRLVGERARGEGDERMRDEFPDEDHPAPLGLRALAPDIEAQVYLLEIAVEREGDAPDARAQEEKSDDGDEMTATPRIELGGGGEVRREHARVHLVIEHRQMALLGGEEGAGGAHLPELKKFSTFAGSHGVALVFIFSSRGV